MNRPGVAHPDDRTMLLPEGESNESKATELTAAATQTRTASGTTAPVVHPEPLVLLTRFTWTSLDGIDTVGQVFNAEIYVECRILGGKGRIPKDFDLQIDFTNNTGTLTDKQVFPELEEDGDDMLYRRRVEGTFADTFDLRHFPFDLQPVEIGLTCNLPYRCSPAAKAPVQHFDLRVNQDAIIFMHAGFKLDNVFSFVGIECREEVSDPSESSSGKLYKRLHVEATVKRMHGWYTWNVIIPS